MLNLMISSKIQASAGWSYAANVHACGREKLGVLCASLRVCFLDCAVLHHNRSCSRCGLGSCVVEVFVTYITDDPTKICQCHGLTSRCREML